LNIRIFFGGFVARKNSPANSAMRCGLGLYWRHLLAFSLVKVLLA